MNQETKKKMDLFIFHMEYTYEVSDTKQDMFPTYSQSCCPCTIFRNRSLTTATFDLARPKTNQHYYK